MTGMIAVAAKAVASKIDAYFRMVYSLSILNFQRLAEFCAISSQPMGSKTRVMPDFFGFLPQVLPEKQKTPAARRPEFFIQLYS
ncbi:MAG: hypothetical protein ACT6U0_28930 [Shinella sp.]|uniref:hypothetical protein n=1 Tax=Shinella sp. TaxID=1870904 RepID=UPI00403622CC